MNLEEQKSILPDSVNQVEQLEVTIAQLESKKQLLEAEISQLQERKTTILSAQMAQLQKSVERMVQEGTKELEERKGALQIAVEKLERRQERIQQEMRTTFAGASQDLAVRVQGFKDYLVGSLQDLAVAAEQLELPSYESWETPSQEILSPETTSPSPHPQFASQSFKEEVDQIRRLIDQYRTSPDYYGPPWQLRRTFEPVHAEKVRSWFFSQGGRGSVRTMGSRLQNILLASAMISILRNLYGDQLRTLLLAHTPERLGEWRRGVQDCLGIARSDFGPEKGIVLFESPEAVAQKADRLIDEGLLPLIMIDETEEQIDLSLLQFPLWLAFAPEPNQSSSYLF
jgi:hypothetical protein